MYRYQASSPTLREDNRLRVFVNRIAKRIFNPGERKYKEDKVKWIILIRILKK
jgi:hypothetical protein